ISESTAAEYIISEEVTYPKATVMAGGEYFISANNAIALPYNNGILPTQPTTAEGDNISDAIYYAYSFENAGNGEFYIRDTNGMYLSASGLSTKDEIKISTTYHNCAWNVTIEDGIAKIRKEGFVLAYNNNAIVAVREENTNATTIYPSLYGIANAPSVFSYTPDSYATELKTISITFSEAVRMEGITSYDQFPLYKAEGNKIPVTMGNWSQSGDILTIVLEYSITENGDYYITIPAGCVVSEVTGKKPAENIIINLSIYNEEQTSIENIDSNNGNTVIYDLNGRRIENITNAGIYIINGKTTLVK
ncbi:MAG: Ig-like domain-containing protein, partial [Bacteroidaceae bacterium]|nr:Ig-like domain-containing protein [Bacteroidaceae bacterium]